MNTNFNVDMNKNENTSNVIQYPMIKNNYYPTYYDTY